MQGLGVFGFGVSASTAEGPIARGFKTLSGEGAGTDTGVSDNSGYLILGSL